MLYEEFLFIRLMEEAAEIQKEAAKCLRFGSNHSYENQTNFERLAVEIQQFLTIVNEVIVEAAGNVSSLTDHDKRLIELRVLTKLRREYNSIHVLKEDPDIVGLD